MWTKQSARDLARETATKYHDRNRDGEYQYRMQQAAQNGGAELGTWDAWCKGWAEGERSA